MRTRTAAMLALLLGSGCSDQPPVEPGDRGASARQEPLFSDEAPATGLDFVHFNGMSGELYMVENVGSGGAMLDYDNDGDLDLFLVQGNMLGPGRTLADALRPPRHPGPVEDRLYRNDLVPGGGLRFTDVTAETDLGSTGYGMGVATGDYNNDGWVDLYVTNFGPNKLFRNNGDGTFTDVTDRSGTGDPGWSAPAAFFDYDNDGWLDLFSGNYVDFRIANHRECLSDSGYRDYCGPQVFGPEADRLYRNRGDGTFEETTRKAGLDAAYGKALGVVAADFDLDGWVDLYVANDAMPNQLWMNNRDGTFSNDALLAGCAINADGAPEASMGVDAGDLDNDGDEDLVLAHLSLETNTVYFNDGTATFEDRSLHSGLGQPSWAYTGFGSGWLDYDNDSWLDYVVVNGTVAFIKDLYVAGDPYPLHQPNQLYRNLGNGRFEEVTALAGESFLPSEVSRGAIFGDIDNDGDTDLLVTNNCGPARMLINRVGHRRHWIGLRLVEPESGRDMLGAWVGVFGPGGTLWRRVRTTRSYVSASDPRVLFGLGESDVVSKIRVQWPGGVIESFPGQPVDRYATLVKGTGQVVENEH